MAAAGSNEAEVIDLDDLVYLESIGLLVPKKEIFEKLRAPFVTAFETMAKNVKPNSIIQHRLQDAVTSAKHANNLTFVENLLDRHRRLWSVSINTAIRESNEEEDKKQEVFDTFEKAFPFVEDKKEFKAVLGRATGRRAKIEKCSRDINELIDDFKRYREDIAANAA